MRKSEISRWRPFEVACFALLALLCVFASAPAAEPPLTDADVERYLPRLRAEASAMEKARREALETIATFVAASQEREKLLADIVSGKKDVLASLRAQTDYALIPDGAAEAVAKSAPACSPGLAFITKIFS